MKTILLSLVILSASFASAADVKVLSPNEAAVLLLKSLPQLKIANENPYEQYDKSAVEIMGEILLSDHTQPTITSVQCEILRGKELCVFNVHHMADPSNTEFSDEYSTQFQYEIDRSSGTPRIKNNTVVVASAG